MAQLPPAISRARKWAPSKTVRKFFAMPPTPPISLGIPLEPCSIYSPMPSTFEATTGTFMLNASGTIVANPSDIEGTVSVSAISSNGLNRASKKLSFGKQSPSHTISSIAQTLGIRRGFQPSGKIVGKSHARGIGQTAPPPHSCRAIAASFEKIFRTGMNSTSYQAQNPQERHDTRKNRVDQSSTFPTTRTTNKPPAIISLLLLIFKSGKRSGRKPEDLAHRPAPESMVPTQELVVKTKQPPILKLCGFSMPSLVHFSCAYRRQSPPLNVP